MIAAALLAAVVSVSPTQHLTYEGIDRTYRVFRPANLPRNRTVPLVVMLHGGFGSGRQAERAYHWDEAAQKYGFVVLYPDGVAHAWNAGTCCGRAAREKIDDVGFLTTLIREVSSEQRIDPLRVVVAGMSNGAMMAYRMGCEAPIALRGIASVAGTMTTPCAHAQQTTLIEIHGTQDRNVPYDGGIGRGLAGVVAAPVSSVIARWWGIDDCKRAIVVAPSRDVTIKTAGCANRTEVILVTVVGAGHQWPGGNPPPPSLARVARAFGIPGLDQPSRALDATETIVHAMQLASP